MKKGMTLIGVLAIAVGAMAGTATYTFEWYKNASVSDFPVPITLEAGVDGFTYEGFADVVHGTDLRAFDGGGTPLPLEVETWNPGGRSVVWVKVPNFSSSTTVTLSWGDPEAAAVDASDMWPDAMAIMHFGDNPGLNSAHGDVFEVKGGAAAIANYAAPVGKGAAFDRSGAYCSTNASAELYRPVTTNLMTVSLWLKTDKLTQENDQAYLFQWGRYTNQGKTAANQMGLLLNYDSNAQVKMYAGANDYSGSFGSPPTMTFPSDGAWHHIAYTYDGSKWTAYMDGYQKGTAAAADLQFLAWGSYGGYLAAGGTRTPQHLLDGAMDEVRFERVCRSAEWIRAQVETQGHDFYAGNFRFLDYTGPALADFPAYIHVDGNMGINPSVLYTSLTNGTAQIRDIRTGALLPVEIESFFNNVYDNALGMWIKMPSFSSADGVVFSSSLPHYTPAGTAQPGNEVDPSGVWDSDDFLFVFHMNPTGYLCDVKSGVQLKPNCRGSQSANFTAYANGYPMATDGPTGPYRAYRSTTNAVQTATPSIARAITNVYTVSWWMKEDADEFATPKLETYVWTILGVSALKGDGYKSHGCGPNRMSIISTSATAVDIPDAGWHHYAYACDGAKTYCYRDGDLLKTANSVKSFALPDSISGKIVHLSGSSNAAKDAFRGNFDELRVETVCRSADWIKATYLNQLAWKDGTPWQFAPHFADDVAVSSDADGGLTATATLSCRTNATVTLFWSRSDGGTVATSWSDSVALGLKDDGLAEGAIASLVPGARYAVRFRAVNEFGEAWSKVRYATVRKQVSRTVRKVSLDVNYEGGETLADFPLCVRIPASNKLPANPALARIFDDDGSPLAWEAETWNPAGESILWVRVPSIAGRKTLTLAFHDSFPADDGEWDADSVWPAGKYVGVWHFAASAKQGVVTKDSSTLCGDIVNNTLGAYVTNGVAGEAYYWPREKSGEMRAVDSGVPFNDFRSGFTFSFWASIPDNETKATGAFVKHELVDRDGREYNQYWIRYDGAAAGTVDFYLNNGKATFLPPVHSSDNYITPAGGTWTVTEAISQACRIDKPDEGWHHYAFIHDGMFLCAYLDGELQRKTFWPFVLNTSFQNYVKIRTGFGNNISAAELAKGALDEYRVERTGRSAAWIKACYDNTKPGSAFVTVGATRQPGVIVSIR